MVEMTLNRQEMELLIVQRAWKDDGFRDEFIADPKATIEKYSGQKLPAECPSSPIRRTTRPSTS